MRTRVKICGITRPEDGRQAALLGADAIGLVFVPASARHVELDAAAEIIAALPPLVSVVALFLDPQPAEVEQVVARLPVDLLQFHGSEPPEFCRAFGRAFDWSRVPELPRPLVLAGGLGPDNVAAAIRRCRPYGVDVSSGVEAGKGIKDAGRMAAFLNEVRRVDSE